MTLSCWHDGTKVIIEVSDRGSGFEPRLRDLNQGSGNRGFGLHLMHSLSDGVEFFDDGRRVRLHKELREDDYVFRNNVRRQSKRRAFREFTRRMLTPLEVVTNRVRRT